MKKILSVIILGTLLTVSVLPAVALAQEDLPTGCTLSTNDKARIGLTCEGCGNVDLATSSDECGMCCLLNSIYTVTDWLFYILMVVVVIMIIVGGATYMMAVGDPEKAGKGKKIIVYGIVGLVIALVARLIPSVVKLMMGM